MAARSQFAPQSYSFAIATEIVTAMIWNKLVLRKWCSRYNNRLLYFKCSIAIVEWSSAIKISFDTTVEHYLYEIASSFIRLARLLQVNYDVSTGNIELLTALYLWRHRSNQTCQRILNRLASAGTLLQTPEMSCSLNGLNLTFIARLHLQAFIAAL